jgi:Family of unknown function (DUF5946)
MHSAAAPIQRVCDQCGAAITSNASCAERFDVLLALDHSRTEPWGSRHGLAFAVFTLQHSRGVSPEAVQRCWEMLHRVYVLDEDRSKVANDLRRRGAFIDVTLPNLAAAYQAPNIFAVTIDDMAEFAAESYALNLDAWCRATLEAWSR